MARPPASRHPAPGRKSGSWRAATLAGQRRIVWNIRQTGLELRDIGRATRMVVRACALLSRRLPRFIVANAHAAVDAHSSIGYARDRFVVIPNGFNLQTFVRKPELGRALRRQWHVSDADFLVGMVARLDPQKDHENFIAAASLVSARLASARFVLVGRGIGDNAQLNKWVADRNLHSKFILQEQRADIPAVMSAFDLFCLSSRAAVPQPLPATLT